MNSGVLAVKTLERKAELFGLNAVQRIDLQVIQTPDRTSRFDKIHAAIMRVKYGPDWQPTDANGDGNAVGGFDDEEPSN